MAIISLPPPILGSGGMGLSTANSFPWRRRARGGPPSTVRCCSGGGGDGVSPPPASPGDPGFDKFAFRRGIARGDNYHRRRGFGHKEETQGRMDLQYKSELFGKLKQSRGVYTAEGGLVTVKLAQVYGFCFGVKDAVQLAYEAREQFPDRRIWLTNEIIHNPTVSKVIMCLGECAISQASELHSEIQRMGGHCFLTK